MRFTSQSALSLATLALVALGAGCSHAPVGSRGLAAAPELEADSPEARLELDKMREVAEVLRKREVSVMLLVPYEDLRAFFAQDLKLGDAAPEVQKAWVELLNRVSTEGMDRSSVTAAELEDVVATAHAVGEFIRFRRSGLLVDGMGFRSVDILEAARSWTPEQKWQLASVLKRATDLGHAGGGGEKGLTTYWAYDRALKEAGPEGVALIARTLKPGDFVDFRIETPAGEVGRMGPIAGLTADGSAIRFVDEWVEPVPLSQVVPGSLRAVTPERMEALRQQREERARLEAAGR